MIIFLLLQCRYWINRFFFYPFRHFVCVRVTMMVIQNKNCTDDTTSNHEHDAIKVCTWEKNYDNDLERKLKKSRNNLEKKNSFLLNLPNSGTASDVAGIVSATMFKNTVRDKRIVTPENKKYKNISYYLKMKFRWYYRIVDN